MLTTRTVIDSYLQDASGYRGEAVEVLLPEHPEEVSNLLRTAAAHQMPLTIAGAGTGLTGARVPRGGQVVSLEKLKAIEIGDGYAQCGAGAILKDVHEAAAKTRQFLGPNPTESSASIGGIFNTNAGGARSFRYGSVRSHVLAAEAVFSDGQIRRFNSNDKVDFAFDPVPAPPVTKNSAGYFLRPGASWIDLLVGSEGTLGIITEVVLKLLPQPKAILSGVIFFPSDDRALEAAGTWRTVEELRLLEYMDGHALRYLRSGYGDIPPNAQAALLIEQNLLSEEDPEVDRWAERLSNQAALEETSWFGFRDSDQARFRDFRHALPAPVTDIVRRNGFSKFGTDFAVPIGRYRELHEYYKEQCEKAMPGRHTIFGHLGDANNHVNLLPETTDQARRVEELIYAFAVKVVSMGGTVAAEHGIGKTKTDLLKLMYSPLEISSMKNVKRRLDPEWILGCGTLFDV